MFITVLVAAIGVNRTLLQRLLGGCGHSPSLFDENIVASLDVAHTAATSLPPSRRCRLNGALLGELLLVTGLAPSLETKLEGGTQRDTLGYRRIS